MLKGILFFDSGEIAADSGEIAANACLSHHVSDDMIVDFLGMEDCPDGMIVDANKCN